MGMGHYEKTIHNSRLVVHESFYSLLQIISVLTIEYIQINLSIHYDIM